MTKDGQNLVVVTRSVTRERSAVKRSSSKWLKTLAHRKGFEPLTPRFVVWCSIQLSYRCGGAKPSEQVLVSQAWRPRATNWRPIVQVPAARAKFPFARMNASLVPAAKRG